MPSTAQVARVWPSWQTVPVCVQTEDVQTHDAELPDAWQAWCCPHAIEELTYGHWFASIAHVVTLWPWQIVPAAEQADGVQVHAGEPPAVEQDWCAAHAAVDTHWVQPPGCAWHVSTPAEPQRVSPAVHEAHASAGASLAASSLADPSAASSLASGPPSSPEGAPSTVGASLLAVPSVPGLPWSWVASALASVGTAGSSPTQPVRYTATANAATRPGSVLAWERVMAQGTSRG